ncbi:MAG TPA: LuxR C-terminal-related transcriptional regulator [Streptosporangiaceae bacterium]|nr:LuxR C-terminal-related transcriptional regulator [Streptosporangiaceae bacterium]
MAARAKQALELVGKHLSNKDIADRLYLPPRTVEEHVASLLLKTGAAVRPALGRLARAALSVGIRWVHSTHVPRAPSADRGRPSPIRRGRICPAGWQPWDRVDLLFADTPRIPSIRRPNLSAAAPFSR